MALIALAFLPVAALEVSTALDQRERAAEEVQAEAVRLARLVASNEQAIVEAVRQLLTTLAQVDSIKRHDREACEPLLRTLIAHNELYANIAVANADGSIRCSAVKPKGAVNLADRAYFQRTLQTRNFTIGDYEVGRITGKPTLNMGYPVTDDAGAVAGIVFVALDLRTMSRLGGRVMLPPNGIMTMTGNENIAMMRYPDPGRWVGERVEPLKAAVRQDETVLGESTAPDGIKRTVAVETLSTPGLGKLQVSVGVAQQFTLANFALRLARRLGVLTGITLVALAGAWILGSVFIVRPARHLVGVARAVSAGNLSVRSSVKADGAEFGEIGAAFNQMADVLARRIAELNEAQGELQRARDELESRVERRTAELQHVQETLLLRNRAIAALNSAVIVTDPNQPDNPVVDVNPAFERITGYSQDETIGRNCRFLQGPKTDPAAIAEIHSAIDGQHDCQVVIRNYRKDGTPFWNEVKISPVRDSEGRLTHFVGVLTDVSRRIEVQETLERTASELARSNEELEQFAYVASHDLQEPLRMVASYTQLLARRYKDKLDQSGQDFIAFAVDGAQRMQGFIRDLLLYSRVGTHGRPFEQLDSGAILNRAMENLRYAIVEKNAQIVTGKMPSVYADPVQLTQLFQNLIGNALKFSRTDPLQIEIAALRKDHEWEFIVQDNGIGIEPRDCEQIFVIFQRLHSRHEYEGTGIGLAICKKIVERHGGRIWVESEMGKGTAFHFTVRDRDAQPDGNLERGEKQ